MPLKVSIDEEIEQIKHSLENLEDTHPDYIPPELKELQSRALAVHAHIENALETRILLQIKKHMHDLKEQDWYSIVVELQPLLASLSYKEKLDIVKGYGDETHGLVKVVTKVNNYRIEFAHPKGIKLRNKYDHTNPKGKLNIRDLLRCLLQANREMDNYFIKVNGIPKMKEKIAYST